MADAPRPLVTVASFFGAGGSVIGPKVAQRLDVDFLGPDVPTLVADAMNLSQSAVADSADEPQGLKERLVSIFGRLSTVTGDTGGSMERLDTQESEVRGRIEKVLARSRERGGVVLGHGGMVVLGSVPWALHVLLRGPSEARAVQGASLFDLDADAARKRLGTIDRSHRDYVRRAYRVTMSDPALYHLVIDSTVLGFEACAELIAAAARERVRTRGSATADRETA